MSERKRGIICAYCGMAWGYDDESPTPELIKEACDHETICVKNPYTAQIRNLKRERDEAMEQAQRLRVQLNHYSQVNEMAEQAFRERSEARELLESEKITRNHIIQRGIEMQKERDEANEELNKKYIEYDKLFNEAELIRIERDQILQALMKIEEIFIDSEDTYDDWLAMGKIARATLERLNQQ